MGEPTRVVAPPRGPIEVRCDDLTARQLASAALARHLVRGFGGPWILGTSLVLGVIMAGVFDSVLVGVVYALVLVALGLALVTMRTRRSFRRLAPKGQLLVSRFDDCGRLTVTTAIGTSAMSPGSIDRVERRSGMVLVRTVPGRRWVILPGQLITDADAEHLLGRRRALLPAPLSVAGSPAGSGALHAPGVTTSSTDTLDLIHVVDAQSRRDQQVAVAAHLLGSRRGRLNVAGVALLAVGAAVLRDWVGISLLVVAFISIAVEVLRAVLAVSRSRPLGQLLRAAVTPTHLVVQEGDNANRLPWSSIRTCTTTRRALILTLQQGVILPLPRALFPAPDLTRLQQLVRDPRSPDGR